MKCPGLRPPISVPYWLDFLRSSSYHQPASVSLTKVDKTLGGILGSSRAIAIGPNSFSLAANFGSKPDGIPQFKSNSFPVIVTLEFRPDIKRMFFRLCRQREWR